MNCTSSLVESFPLKTLCAGWCFRCRSLACEWETLFIDKLKTNNSAIVLIKIDLVKRLTSWEKVQNLPNQLLCLWLSWIISFVKIHWNLAVRSGSKEWTSTWLSIKPIKEPTYGKDHAVKWTVYRRTFFIAVAELFA